MFTPFTIHPADTADWLVFDQQDQPVLPEISINPELRSVTATYRFRSDRWSTPMDVYHGRRYLLGVSVWGGYADAAATIRMLAEDYAEDIALICDGYTAEWNGSNTVGRLTAEGCAALDRITRALGDSPRIDADHAGLWYAEEWLAGNDLDDITCATTDTEIDDLASGYERLAACDYVILVGTAAYLRQFRDDLIDAAADNWQVGDAYWIAVPHQSPAYLARAPFTDAESADLHTILEIDSADTEAETLARYYHGETHQRPHQWARVTSIIEAEREARK